MKKSDAMNKILTYEDLKKIHEFNKQLTGKELEKYLKKQAEQMQQSRER